MVNGVTVEKKKLQPGDVLTLGLHEYEIRFQVKNRDPVKSSHEEASFSGIMRGVIDWEGVVEKEKADLLSKDESDSEKGKKPSTIDNQQKCKQGNFMPATLSREVRLDTGGSTQINLRILSCGPLSLNVWMSCQIIQQTESMSTIKFHPARKLEIIRPDGVVAAQQSFQPAEVNSNGEVTLDYTINSNDPAGLWKASVTLEEQNEHLVKLTLTHPSIVQL